MIKFLSSGNWKHIPLCLLLPAVSLAQDVLWEKSYGGKHADYLFDAVPTADYGFILAGSSLSGKTGNKSQANKGNLDYWVWKMDEAGELVWQKSFGGSGIDLLQSVKLTNDGGFLLAGSSNSPKGGDKKEDGRGDTDFWIIKLDAGGGEQWQKTLGGNGVDEIKSVTQTRDGGYVLGGTSSSEATGDKNDQSRGSTDYWIVKLAANGTLEWQKTYGGQSADYLISIAPTADGGCIVGGYSNSSEAGDKTSKCNGAGDFWILKLDDHGIIDWQQTYGGAKDDHLSIIFQSDDGNYLLGGYSNSGGEFNKTSSSRDGSDFWVLKLNTDGQSIWQETYDFGKYDILTSLVENKDGSLLIGGTAKKESVENKDKEGTNDYIALKITSEGKRIWDRTLGSDGEDVMRKLIETRDGGYLLAGTSNPEAVRLKKRNKKGDGKNLAVTDRAQQHLDGFANETFVTANNFYSEQTNTAKKALNDAIGQEKESPFKMGIGTSENLLNLGHPNSENETTSGGGKSHNDMKKLPASRQKSDNFGKHDFWVVKLKDKDKKETTRENVEAIPNPAHDYTNVILGYEYEKGTATLYDINGRQLQSFSITQQTIPISFEDLPEGIYIVQIKTNKSTDSVKIIKSSN